MTVLVEHADRIRLIRIDRPAHRNAVDRSTAEKLAHAFRDFDRDPEAHVAILLGTGGTFCAGADLHAIASGTPNRLEVDGDAPMGPSRLRLHKPVIALLQGHAVAGGLELACWAHLRVMEEDATLGVFCRRWGVPLIDGGTARLPRLIGESRAMDLILTGRPVDAREALDIGLVHRIAPPGEGRRVALELAAQLCRFPQTTLRTDLRSTQRALDLPLDAALRAEFLDAADALGHDTRPGAERFAAGAGRHGSFDNID
ncbi:MAG: crotonase/enoyl-CoA hydratase family protein [Deltaproteobacteria bacterium]|nr:MAG: crotonase/enoyl-CoA hydratase family protein [Deltaproteobacteria bacterium]